MAFLSKATAPAMLAKMEELCALNKTSVVEMATLYREGGYAYPRFLWAMYFAIPNAVRNEILMEHNQENMVLVGGYWTTLKDSHIETMLKAAFRNVAPAW